MPERLTSHRAAVQPHAFGRRTFTPCARRPDWRHPRPKGVRPNSVRPNGAFGWPRLRMGCHSLVRRRRPGSRGPQAHRQEAAREKGRGHSAMRPTLEQVVDRQGPHGPVRQCPRGDPDAGPQLYHRRPAALSTAMDACCVSRTPRRSGFATNSAGLSRTTTASTEPPGLPPTVADKYRIIATTFGGGQTGDYTVTITPIRSALPVPGPGMRCRLDRRRVRRSVHRPPLPGWRQRQQRGPVARLPRVPLHHREQLRIDGARRPAHRRASLAGTSWASTCRRSASWCRCRRRRRQCRCFNRTCRSATSATSR